MNAGDVRLSARHSTSFHSFVPIYSICDVQKYEFKAFLSWKKSATGKRLFGTVSGNIHIKTNQFPVYGTTYELLNFSHWDNASTVILFSYSQSTTLGPTGKYNNSTTQGLYSLRGKASYNNIAWSFDAARLDVIMIVSF